MVIVWWGARNRAKDGKGNTDGKNSKRESEESLKQVRLLWMVPVVYGVVAGVEAVLAGSVVGLM